MHPPLSIARRHLVLFALALLLPLPASAAGLTAYTEEWAPYNYTDDGEIRGIATDLLRAACDDAKIDCRIAVVPWARAYSNVLNNTNTLIYTIARTPSRENEFAWVGPLLPRTTWIYGRAELAPRVHEAKDLSGRRIGVVRDDATGPDLIAAGVPASALIVDSSNEAVLRMYRRGMIDALIDTEIGMAWSLRKAAMPAGSVSRLVKLSESGAYYFALNRNSDPQLVRSLQQAVDKLKRDGTLEAIKRKYLEAGD